ncbi:MAG: hypothetical protein AB2693_19305, partial [Candidatus Thiodiazotropha sp.]
KSEWSQGMQHQKAGGLSASVPMVIEDEKAPKETMGLHERVVPIVAEQAMQRSGEQESQKTQNMIPDKHSGIVEERDSRENPMQGQEAFLGNGRASTKKAIRKSC